MKVLVTLKFLARSQNSDPRSKPWRDLEPDFVVLRENGELRPLYLVDVED